MIGYSSATAVSTPAPRPPTTPSLSAIDASPHMGEPSVDEFNKVALPWLSAEVGMAVRIGRLRRRNATSINSRSDEDADIQQYAGRVVHAGGLLVAPVAPMIVAPIAFGRSMGVIQPERDVASPGHAADAAHRPGQCRLRPRRSGSLRLSRARPVPLGMPSVSRDAAMIGDSYKLCDERAMLMTGNPNNRRFWRSRRTSARFRSSALTHRAWRGDGLAQRSPSSRARRSRTPGRKRAQDSAKNRSTWRVYWVSNDSWGA